jgi:hypothetical protein
VSDLEIAKASVERGAVDGEHIGLRSGDNAPNRPTDTDPSRRLPVAQGNAERTLGSGIQRAAFGGKQQYRDRTLASLRLPRVRECSSDETTSAWASGALLGTLVVGPRAAQPAVPVTFCP